MSSPLLNARVVRRIDIAPGLMHLFVAPDNKVIPEFQAGQFAVLGLPASAPRCAEAVPDRSPIEPTKMLRGSYSIASSANERGYLEFYLTMVPHGALTPRLFHLQAGDAVWLSPKITGYFTLTNVQDDANVLFVSTGTGIAPYMSMLRTYLSTRPSLRFFLFHGVRSSADLGYRDELETLMTLTPHFKYVPFLSNAKGEILPWHGYTGYAQHFWQNGSIEKVVGKRPAPDDSHVFLCGNPAMVDTMIELLKSEGFKEHAHRDPGQIHFERYW